MDQNIIYWAGAVLTIGAAITYFWTILRALNKRVHLVMDNLDSFMRDWSGEPAAPGRSAVPGVMERLNRIDGELKRNGGSSMKDSLARVEKKLEQMNARLEEGNKRFDVIEEKIS